MNSQEATLLCRYTKACCPAQKFDEFSPDAWFDLLGDLQLNDAKDAVRALAQTQVFVAPAEIRAKVARLRADRAAYVSIPPYPHQLANNPKAEIEWREAFKDRIADGFEPEAAEAWANQAMGIKPEPRALTSGLTPDMQAEMQHNLDALARQQSLARQESERRYAEFAEKKRRHRESVEAQEGDAKAERDATQATPTKEQQA